MHPNPDSDDGYGCPNLDWDEFQIGMQHVHPVDMVDFLVKFFRNTSGVGQCIFDSEAGSEVTQGVLFGVLFCRTCVSSL
jgi:hypothetical protein